MENHEKLLESKGETEVMTPEVMRKKRAELRRHLVLVAIGFCLVYCGYSAMVILQTSVNIENGEGATITSIAYFNAVAVCFLFPANMVRFYGVKSSVILSEFCFVIYLIGNLTSNHAVLQVCAIIASFGDAILWIPIGLLVAFFGKRYMKYSPGLEEDKCFAKMAAIMFPIIALNSVIGNAVVYLVLKITSPSVDDVTTNTTVSDMTSPNVTSAREVNYIQFCGANDCQNSNITSAQIDLYVPPKRSIYIFISCLISLQLCGIFLHFKFIPVFQLHEVNRDECDEGEKLRNIWQLTSTIARTLKLFFFDINQWLLFIPGAYLGFSTAFLVSEVSRAYVSCTLGVANIGALIVMHSCVYAAIQPLWSKLVVKKGRIYSMIMWPVVDTTFYLICLLWVPTRENAIYVVVLIYVVAAITFSNIQLLISLFYSLIFPNNLEITFIFWNISFFCGFSVQFGWSQYLCVYMKIYLNIAMLYLAVFFLFFLNRRLNKKQKISKKSCDVINRGSYIVTSTLSSV